MDACRDTEADLTVIVRLDVDDPTLDEYGRLQLPDKWHLHVGPRVRCAPTFNELFRMFPDEEAYGLLSDDMVPVTFNWDKELYKDARASFITGAADGFSDRVSAMFIPGDLARAAGWLGPSGFMHLYLDTVWEHIGKSLGILHQRNDVVIKHVHFANEAPMDKTYQDHFEFGGADTRRWHEWLTNEAPSVIERIRECLV